VRPGPPRGATASLAVSEPVRLLTPIVDFASHVPEKPPRTMRVQARTIRFSAGSRRAVSRNEHPQALQVVLSTSIRSRCAREIRPFSAATTTRGPSGTPTNTWLRSSDAVVSKDDRGGYSGCDDHGRDERYPATAWPLWDLRRQERDHAAAGQSYRGPWAPTRCGWADRPAGTCRWSRIYSMRRRR
jgi:hypothetical protein